jgi:SPX domain protein involved in polyphosphate accumulation
MTQTILFNRLEAKYLVDRTTRTALTRDLSALMSPDLHAGPGGFYKVRSLYFDTADYMAYHEKMAGTAIRHKLRIRAYGEQPAQMPQVRLEVKSRYLSYIYKITVDVTIEDYEQIEQALRHRELPPAKFLDNRNHSREFFRIQRQYNMEPVILIEYRRQAFERLELNRVRVNFDDELVSSRNLEVLERMKGGRRMLQYGYAIFEIKVDNVMPFWLHKLISKYNLQNEAVSKYCYAVRGHGRMTPVARERASI